MIPGCAHHAAATSDLEDIIYEVVVLLIDLKVDQYPIFPNFNAEHHSRLWTCSLCPGSSQSCFCSDCPSCTVSMCTIADVPVKRGRRKSPAHTSEEDSESDLGEFESAASESDPQTSSGTDEQEEAPNKRRSASKPAARPVGR